MSLFGLQSAAFDKSSTRGAVRVRPLVGQDRTAWNALWKGYLEFYKTELPAAQYDLTFGRFLNPSEPMFAYLAERDGTPRGLVHIILHRSGWLEGPACYLQDLFVDPGERGTGMGHALIEHVYDVIRTAGGKKVYWLTHESNATARQLYDRVATNAGFIQYAKNL
ncbi:MAG: GNAT family N-acetyltransferase [Alphaproteobacteria bacterium]|nr:GNAT family N-acetyltransferase [Alphaproteobacteria bacterium]